MREPDLSRRRLAEIARLRLRQVAGRGLIERAPDLDNVSFDGFRDRLEGVRLGVPKGVDAGSERRTDLGSDDGGLSRTNSGYTY